MSRDGYQRLAQRVIDQAITDAKIGHLNAVTHELIDSRGYRARHANVVDARAWLRRPSPWLTLWVSWIGLDVDLFCRKMDDRIRRIEAREAGFTDIA